MAAKKKRKKARKSSKRSSTATRGAKREKYVPAETIDGLWIFEWTTPGYNTVNQCATKEEALAKIRREFQGNGRFAGSKLVVNESTLRPWTRSAERHYESLWAW